MKHSVISDELHEFDIRPRETHAQFVDMLRREAAALDRGHFEPVNDCPVCQSADSGPAFEKWDFPFNRCARCGSLFNSCGPSAAEVERMLADSAALAFWIRTVLPAAEVSRQEHIFEPRVDWMLDLAMQHGRPLIRRAVDYGPRHAGQALQLRRAKAVEHVVVLPLAGEARAVCREAGLDVVERLDPASADLIMAFETLESDVGLRGWFQRANRALLPGGLLFLTMRAGSGFDMRVLGASAPNLLPPLHRVLPSVDGMRTLLAQTGFDALEISTPGQLDVQTVKATAQAGASLPPFVDQLIREGDASIHQAFQEFLQRARLSSHMRVAARRRQSV